MSVKIRLRRMGRTNRPFYRVVATDSRCSNSGRFLETLGWYDPAKAAPNFSLKLERVDYWKSNGAIFSDTVKSLVRKARKGLGVAPQVAVEPEAAAADAEGDPVVAAVEEPVAAGATTEADADEQKDAAQTS